VFLVGPSGSGKTTLLSILGCILTPDQGAVQVLGQDAVKLPCKQRAVLRREKLGYIFQTFNLFPTLSALDNVHLALAMRGISLQSGRQRARQLLQQVGLEQRARLRPAQLSTGECQRVAIARALAADPAILFADEPTAALDAENGRAVLQLLSQLVRERGTSLVVVTHDERIFPFADRILRLEDGRLTHEWVATETAKPNRESAPAGFLQEIKK
jgi:putative ABC transport system ATP-binding protein